MTAPYRSWRTALVEAIAALDDEALCHRCYVAIREYQRRLWLECVESRETAEGTRLKEEGLICAEECERRGKPGLWKEALQKWRQERGRR